MSFWIVLFLIGGAVGLFLWIKSASNTPEAIRERENSEMSSSMRVVFESVAIASTSKNFSTRISRIEVCIQILTDLSFRYPHRSDIQELLSSARGMLYEEHKKNVHAKITKALDRSETMASLAGKKMLLAQPCLLSVML
jgi:hypothetical protein